MEEMTAAIDQNSNNAKTTESIALASAREIESSNQSSQQAITSMLKIKEEIKAISEIANQTNILAFV